MHDRAVGESDPRLGIGRVVVRAQAEGLARRHEAPQQFLDGLSRGLGVRSPVPPLKATSMLLLPGPHRAAPPQLCVVEAVDVVGLAHDEVEIERPVLARLEAPKAVQHQDRLGLARSPLLVKQQAVTAQPIGLTLHGLMRDLELRSDLPQRGAAEQSVEEVSK